MSRVYDHAWRQARARALKGSQVCHICGGSLDYDAPARSPQSPSVDHVFPVKHMRGLDPESRRRLILDSTNLRPVHYGCNSRRQAGRARPAHTSRAWR